jgi:NADPH:quinone reductase-like Zn-dependent oxidoreductase
MIDAKMVGTQQCIQISRRGGPDVLTVVNAPMPEPGPDQVRIRVLAAGVAFADVLMREGLYPGTPSFPFVPGYDVVGEIDAVGAKVESTIRIGERVAALTVTGGYARYVLVAAEDCVPVPENVDAGEAVTLVLNYLTAYQMLHRVAAVTAGSRILVHGAAGGAGSALVELATAIGCTVYGTASKAKHPLLARLGAVPIDYRNEDFVARIRELTETGVDAVFDPIGGSYWRRSFATLRAGGVMICYGASATTDGGRRSIWNILRLLVGTPYYTPLSFLTSSLGVRGFNVTLWKRSRPGLYRADLARLLEMLADGAIAPVIAARLPLERAAEAHAMLNGSSVSGKIILQP